MTEKERAIQRIAVFLSDRIDYAIAMTARRESGDVRKKSFTDQKSIEELLSREFERIPEKVIIAPTCSTEDFTSGGRW